MSFVSEALTPHGIVFDAAGLSTGEPVVPAAFTWRDETLAIASIKRTWRSTKTDRGEAYLKRHWYDTTLADGRSAVIYFDRGARKGAPRWWLYTLV